MANRALIYQIYPASFGNLKFIASKIPTIAATLKPDYIWLSPIFLSPWKEGGYDIADYLTIDPQFGTMADFDNLVKTAKTHNVQILLDLVLNHTSVEHDWFQKSRHRDPWYEDYYIWRDRPLNWQSFFGGTAYEYDQIRGQYYLHLFDKSQPDLNFANPRVIREFRKIIDFWVNKQVAGFRVDSTNVLVESKYRHGFIPRIPGFFNYFQSKDTIKTLDNLLGGNRLFTVAEPVGGTFFSISKFHELTQRAFDASFNVGTLDIADTYFSDRAHPHKLQYKRWFRMLARWTVEPKFSFALESHDTPRAPSRYNADPKALAMMQFLLPSYYPCIYQGQELGMQNPKLSDDINNHDDMQSRMVYRSLRKESRSDRAAMAVVKRFSRDNARQPINWKEYDRQVKASTSVRNFYLRLVQLWRTDPVLINGTLKIRKTTKSGVLDFERSFEGQTYHIHLDLPAKTPSTLINHQGEIILSSK